MKLSNRQRDKSKKIELSMTSMIDVVFLLLIFFLVTTTFVTPERQIKSNIKVQNQSTATRPSDLDPAVIDVVQLNGKSVYKLGAITTNDIDELKKTLEAFENKFDGAFVRVSDDVEFGKAALAVNACKQAGFSLVSYIPLKENE